MVLPVVGPNLKEKIVKSTRKLAAIFAGTTALALLLSTSASAEDRHRDGTARSNDGYRDGARNNDGYRNGSRNNDGYRGQARNDNRISEKGRIRSFTRERDGYRVFLDHGNHSYWVPASRLGRHQLRVGIDVRLGGIFNGGYVDVDALGWPGDPYYNDPYYGGGYGGGYSDRYDGILSGRVERVDLRYGTLLLRDDRSGRVVEVDMRATERRRGLDLGDLRRGDRVTLAGSWDGGYFHAYRIDGVRQY
jgi:hypothetical protein